MSLKVFFDTTLKKAFFLCFLSMLFCCRKPENDSLKRTGALNTISVIIDDQLWNGEVGDSIRNKFAAPAIGLPEEEPLFTINQFPIRLLEGFTNNRNVIVVKKQRDSVFEIRKNEFTKPQNIFYISEKTASGIISIIEAHSRQMIDAVHQTEISESLKFIDTLRLDDRKILKKFNISAHIPKAYRYTKLRKNFMWLKKEITSGNCSLLIYQLPGNAIHLGDTAGKLLQFRDSIGRLYIRGTAKRSAMTTDESYAPYLFNSFVDGRQAFEMRGKWEMENDFMSGPFVSYSIFDPARKQILVIEGFCYAPSEKKRDLMTEFEAIIMSVRFIKHKRK